MPGISCFLRDKIFTFGEYWKEILLSTNFWKEEEIESVGNSKATGLRRKYKDKKDNFKRDQSKALFVYTSSAYLRDESVAFMDEALKIAGERKIPLEMQIKLHPQEGADYPFYDVLHQKYPDRCVVKYHHEKNIYDYFIEADVHLSVYSATIFESLNFGTPTGILNITGKDFFIDLIDKGYLKLMASPESLVDCAQAIMDKSGMWQQWFNKVNEGSKEGSNYFYKNYSLDDLVDNLNYMVNQG